MRWALNNYLCEYFWVVNKFKLIIIKYELCLHHLTLTDEISCHSVVEKNNNCKSAFVLYVNFLLKNLVTNRIQIYSSTIENTITLRLSRNNFYRARTNIAASMFVLALFKFIKGNKLHEIVFISCYWEGKSWRLYNFHILNYESLLGRHRMKTRIHWTIVSSQYEALQQCAFMIPPPRTEPGSSSQEIPRIN